MTAEEAKKPAGKRAKVLASVDPVAVTAAIPAPVDQLAPALDSPVLDESVVASIDMNAPAVPADTPGLAAPAGEPAAAAPLPHERMSAMNETIMKPFEQAVPAMEKAAADAQAHAKANYDQMNARMTEMMEQAMKSMTEMSEFAKGNLEAMMASAKAATAGAETLSSTMVETTKKQMEEAQAAWKAMTSAKTPNEMLTAQNEFAKAQFEKTVAAWSHLSETMLKLTGEVVQPLSNRVAVAAETVKKSIAA